MKTAPGKVLITAPTGQIGPHAATYLLERGWHVRALVPMSEKDLGVLPPEVEVVRGDLGDRGSIDEALEGVSHVFWMWPFFYVGTENAPYMAQQMSRRRMRVTVVSSVGVHIGIEPVDNNCHAYLEEQLKASDCQWTILRTTGFMGNARGWAQQIRKGGVVRFPYGDAARTPVHERDLSECGAITLMDDEHIGQTYLISGPQDITQKAQVDIIGELLGREIEWIDVEAAAAREKLVSAGWPPSYAEGALEYFKMLTEEIEVCSYSIEHILGREPRSFHAWAEENIDEFV